MIRDDLKSFLSDKADRLKPATAEFYASRSKWIDRNLGASDWGDLNPQKVLSALDGANRWPDGKHKNPDTQRGNAIAWQQFQGWAIETGRIPEPVTKPLPKPAGRIRNFVPSIDDIRRVIDGAQPDFAAIYRALLLTGARPGRTRRDVGRELPALSKITTPIDHDTAALDEIHDAAHELAKILMADSGRGLEKMEAASELDMMVRKATGVAKAPHVAAFVEMLLENGEPVVLFGWHRAVYDIWQSRLAKHSPAFYTGTESPTKKQAEVNRFLEGQTNLIIVSLRSGAGLDGLQRRARSVVIGELDWSPAVHEQCIGRVYRDGQTDPVTAYFLLADSGSDPMVAEIVGVKRQQIDGLVGAGGGPLQQVDSSAGIRQIAEQYLNRKRR